MFDLPPRQSHTLPAVAVATSLIRQRAGLALDDLDTDRVEAALLRALDRLHVASVDAVAARLAANDPRAFDVVLDEITIHETHFFREIDQIDRIRDILPRLLENRPDGLRVWSAGCSTGEEAYTLAILLEEAGCLQISRVVGTDISRTALERARAAVYRPWSMRGVDAGLKRLWFRELGDTFEIDPRIRNAVDFHHLNLLADEYTFSVQDMDLILCRNVFIYLTPQGVQHAALRLVGALRDGGWLVLGPSDPVVDDLPCDRIVTPAGTFYRKSSSVGQSVNLNVTAPLSSTVKRGGASDPLTEAASALRRGDAETAIRLTRSRVDADASIIHLRALQAAGDPTRTVEAAARAVALHPLCAEIHFLHALALIDSGSDDGALEALRNVIYLDPTLALPHFVLGSLHARLKNKAAARRAYRNARDASGVLPRDAILHMSQGERAGTLHDAATELLRSLDQGV